MKLLTKAIETQLRKQFPLGDDMDQLVVAKFFDPCGSWSWYVMNQDPGDPSYLWGIVKGFEVETGSINLEELSQLRGPLGLGIERDLHFKPRPARDVWDALNRGEHV